MCRFKSAIILKDRIYLSDIDSHSDLLRELNIDDTRKNAENLFIRAELSPDDGDVFSKICGWGFKVDQDITPDWYVYEYDRQRVVDAVKEWAKSHIHIDESNFRIGSGAHYLKNCKDVICGNSTVKAFDNSTVKAFDNSTVEAFDNSTVKAFGNSTVKAFDNSTVKAFGNSTVKAFDNSTVKAFGNSTVTAYDNSTVKAFGNSTVTACGNSTVEAFDNSTVKAFGNSTVTACGNSTVEAFGNSTVKAFDNSTVKAYDNSTVEAYDNSTVAIPGWSSNKRENIVLMQNSTLKDCKTKTLYQSGNWKLVVVDEVTPCRQ